MKPRTLQFIDGLFERPWFANLGSAQGADIHVVKDWNEALNYLDEADETFLTLRNEYTSRMHRENRRAMQKWNDIASVVTSRIEPPIDANVAMLGLVRERAIRVRDIARWCVLNACMETEYSDVADYGHFAGICQWLVRGNLPCGWAGKYPEGRLAVF